MKLESSQWQVEDQTTKDKVTIRQRSSHVSFQTARDVSAEASKKLKSKSGTKLHATAPNGSVYFVTATE